MRKRKIKCKRKHLLIGGTLLACLLLLIMVFFLTGVFGSSAPLTVGADIPQEAITEFYYTTASSTYPPHYQRYHFYKEDAAWKFCHETREGTHWPLTEADATFTGEADLSSTQEARFFSLLQEGTLQSREVFENSGDSGPWLYLYWEGDRGDLQAFAFSSYSAQEVFADFCRDLADGSYP